MTAAHDLPPDHGALVYRHHEQLYRLALLVAGDADSAATLVEGAYRDLPDRAPDAEAALIRSLLPTRRPRRPWRWRADRADAARAVLSQVGADALLGTVAATPPATRLAIGLHYLRGMTTEEIGGLLGEGAGEPAPAEALARFRIDAARALGLVPTNADPALLSALDGSLHGTIAAEEALALRRAVLDRPDLRALRDGLAEVRDLLPRALPALFAVTPPLVLTDRLLAIPETRRRSIARPGRLTRAHGLLALGVLALVVAIVLGPSLLPRRGGPALGAPRTAGELIDAAINRFSQAPLNAGVLHEQYRVQIAGRQAYLIERWYDYAAPHRLRVTITAEGKNDPPLMEISSDGRSLVQYRYSSDVFGFEKRLVDAYVSEAEAQAVVPVLRGEPSATFFWRDVIDYVDVSPLYLGQARASNPTFLGQTSALGRPAFLVAYRTDQPPMSWMQRPTTSDQPVRVVLTIDAQTYTLLDIAVLADGAEESTARRPLRAQQIDVLSSVPNDRFTLPGAAGVVQRSGVQSAHVPDIPNTRMISLGDALRSTPHTLLAPQQLPDTNMRGLVLALDGGSPSEIVLLYEGEFLSVLVAPGELYGRRPTEGEERSAGAFRYRILPSPRQQAAGLTAEVYRPDTPGEQTIVLLVDEYATSAEREATLQELIASLTPLTEQSLPVLEPAFSHVEAAGGQG